MFQVQPMQIVASILRGEKLQVPLGDPIPTIEMLIEIHPDGSRIAKVLPRWLQRRVTQDDIKRHERARVRSNEPVPDFLTSNPTLIMEASRFDQAAGTYLGVRNVFVVPAHFLIKPRLGLPIVGPKPYTVYCHTFGDAEDEGAANYFYYGITQRSWQERWAEHARAINTGSRLKFHKVFREEVAGGKVTFIGHDVVHVADSIDELYGWEEDLVAAAWGDPMLLNMIPGGNAGIAYMAKHGMLGRHTTVRPDQRDKLLDEWITKHSRAGLPAPWVAERWQNPEWASSFVCTGVGRLTEQQIRHIRTLGEQGISVEEIRNLANARTLDQVRGVLSGRTYSRVI
ncbi:hypothetical protein MPC1_9700002 [Methylocella tundrae]|nr:hypothetical protein MPC1_9700002 [Methylocella tundrae]